MISVPSMPELPEKRGPPWIETPAGGLFFVNALLAAPALMVAYAVVLRALVRALFDVPAAILDPIPMVAAHLAPAVGWLAAPALVLTAWNLRLADRRWARIGLVAFAFLHLVTLLYTVARWTG